MIWADYRETGGGVIEALRKSDASLEVKSLAVGDYIIDGKVVVERKTSQDFVSSLYSGRLFRQLAALKRFGRRQLMIIEGLPLTMIRGARPEAIKGALISLAVSWGLPILYSDSPKETAWILEKINQRSAKSRSSPVPRLRLGKKTLAPERQKRQILESLPSIGPKLAREMITAFGSLNNILSASEEQLRAVKGIGPKKARNIRNILREEKSNYLMPR